MIAGPKAFVILVIEVIVFNDQLVEPPDMVPAAVVKLLADQDVIKRLPRLLVDMGVIDVGQALQLLERLGRIEIGVAACRPAERLQIIWLEMILSVLLCWPSLRSPSTTTGSSVAFIR